MASSSNKVIFSIIAIIVIAVIAFSSFSSKKVIEEIKIPVEKAKVINKTKDKVNTTTTEQLVQKTTPKEQIPSNVTVSFVEGSHYITKFPNEQSDGPIVIEFFSYMCPHCYNFEPTIKRWLKQKPESVSLLKVPVTFGQSAWRLAAKSYYIAEELKMVDTFSAAMFKKIHLDKKPPITEDDIGDIFTTLGVKSAAFKKAASSFNVDSKLRKADFLAKKYKVSGVPYFLLNYKYEIGRTSYESEEALFQLMNQLPIKDFK